MAGVWCGARGGGQHTHRANGYGDLAARRSHVRRSSATGTDCQASAVPQAAFDNALAESPSISMPASGVSRIRLPSSVMLTPAGVEQLATIIRVLVVLGAVTLRRLHNGLGCTSM